MTATATHRYASVFRPGLFAGQVHWVTGGGSGIGRCVAHELASLGATVVISGRTQAKLDAVAAEIVADGGRCATHVAFDIRDEEAVKAGVAGVIAAHGPVAGLVNNAGGQFPAPLLAISKKGFDAVVANNLTGGFLMMRELFNQCMQAARWCGGQHDRRLPQRHARHGPQRRRSRRHEQPDHDGGL